MRHLYTMMLILAGLHASAQFGSEVVISQNDISYPSMVAAADVDGDGSMDLLTVKLSGSTRALVCWFNDGQGNYGDMEVLHGALPAGNNNGYMLDMNNDGLADFVSKDQWYPGTGGVLGDPIPYGFGISNLFGCNDLNGDGSIDLVARGSSGLQVFLNDGQGNFSPGAVLGPTTSFTSVDIQFGDMDSDGLVDILITGSNSWWGWYANLGGGNFGPRNTSTGLLASQIGRLWDMDGDGHLDLITFGVGPGPRLLINDGAGSFTLTDTLPTLLGGEAPEWFGDLDGDGHLDFTRPTGTSCDVKLVKYDGTDWHLVDLEIFSAYSLQYTRYAVADLDGDGDLDVAFAHGKGILGWFAQEADGAWSPRHKGSWTLSETRGLAAADLDGDGSQDVVAASSLASMITMHINDGSGQTFQNSIIMENFHRVSDVELLDVDGDGDLDIVASSATGAKWLGNTGDLSVWITHDIPGAGGGLDVADLDGDGSMDLVVGGSVYFNDGAGNFTPLVLTTDPDLQVGIGDLNGDGLPDVVFNRMFPDESAVAINDGGGAFTFHPLSTNWKLFDIADLDGDGSDDVIAWVFTPGLILHLSWDGNGGFVADTLVVDLPQGMDGAIKCMDLDLDGDLDILWSYSYGYTHRSFAIENLGGGEFGELVMVADHADVTRKFLGADLDGDGLEDILVGNTHGIFWYKNLFVVPFRMKGSVFMDNDEDGILDPGELKLPFRLVESDGNQALTWTNWVGDFDIPGGLGTWWVTSPLFGGMLATTPDTLYATLSADEPVATGLDFGRTSVPPDAVIDVSRISTARCFENAQFRVAVVNLVGGPFTGGLLGVQINDAMTFTTAVPLPDSVAGDWMYWHVPDLAMGAPFYVDLGVQMGQAGVSALVEATLDLPGFDEQFTDAYGFMILCSYDPNDKLVTPQGYGEFGAVDIDTPWLDYKVRFQNTGTAPAEVVVIKDVIDAGLDPSSLKVVHASHPITELKMSGDTLVFRFDGIMLPDSGADPIGSNGFVRYKMKPRAGQPSGTEIRNTAHIFFDLNEPVVTNTVLNTLVDCNLFNASITEGAGGLLTASEGEYYQWFLNEEIIPDATEPDFLAVEPGSYTVTITSVFGCVATSDSLQVIGTGVAEQGTSGLSVWPNPADGSILITAEHPFTASDEFRLIDLRGSVLRTMAATPGPMIEVARNGLAPGVYILELRTSDRPVGRIPVVWR